MTAPFSRVLVPYDGSAPAERALEIAIALGRSGSGLDVLNVVDETPVIAQTTVAAEVFDPTPFLDALEQNARTLLDAAARRAAAAGVDAAVALERGRPVGGIVRAAAAGRNDLIALGTHGRTGLPRTFLGSTTEGVLRSTHVPVLAVKAAAAAGPVPTPVFRTVLVAVDESDPSRAAVALAGRLSQTLGTHCLLTGVVDDGDLYDKAAVYGYDPEPLAREQRERTNDTLDQARAHGSFGAGAVEVVVVEGRPAEQILAEAERRGVDAIVMGSHGRRGLQRLVLGSVAEHVLRHSPLPVLIVRA